MVAIVKPQRALIRQMQVFDLDIVHANEFLAYEFPWTRSIFADCLRVGYPCKVLEYGDVVIGHGIISVAANEAHLLNICIQPAYQGQGYGRRLLQHCMNLAKQGDANKMFLEVRPSNFSAIRLYQAEGFSVIGHRPDYYRRSLDRLTEKVGREDALVMSKNFNSI